MINRMLILLLILLLLTACHAPWKAEAPVRPMDLYYPAVGETTYDLQTGGLTVKTVDLGTKTYRIPEHLTMYLQAPVPEDAMPVLPNPVSVEGQSLKDRCLTLRMSKAWDTMADMDRRLAEACLLHIVSAQSNGQYASCPVISTINNSPSNAAVIPIRTSSTSEFNATVYIDSITQWDFKINTKTDFSGTYKVQCWMYVMLLA